MSNYLDSLKEEGFAKRTIGIHKESKKIVTLEQMEDQIHNLHPVRELSESESKKLVLSYWNSGSWSDFYHDSDLITLEVALQEVEKNSDLGKHLIQNGIRAMEMIHEDLVKHNMKMKGVE